MFRLAMIGAVVVLVGGMPTMAATSIPIGNPSFEDPVMADHIVLQENYSLDITPWEHARIEGAYNPSSAQYPGATDQEPDLDTPIPDGKNVAFISVNGDVIFQNLTEPLTANTTYTLSAWFGERFDSHGTAQYDMRLVAGGSVVGSVEGSLTNGWIQDSFTTDVTGDNPAIGEPLRIEIWRPTGSEQLNIDAVSLTAVPIPEPSSTLMLACGAFGLLGYAWRRRSSKGTRPLRGGR